MLELKNITKKYEDRVALENVNIIIPNQGFFAILGKSGSGKTTLLNLIGGLDKPTCGNILYNNLDITELNDEELASYRKQIIGFSFQEEGLIKNKTVIENIKIALEIKEKDLEKDIYKILKRLGIDNLEKRKIKELSGGQKARVLLARALIAKPKILLVDEPTSHVDSNTAASILEVLKEVSKEALVIVVTHDKEEIEPFIDEIITINNGNLSNKALRVKEEDKCIITASDAKKGTITKISKNLYKETRIRNILFSMALFILLFLFVVLMNMTSNNTFAMHANSLKQNYKLYYGIEVFKKAPKYLLSNQNLKDEELQEIVNFLEENKISYELNYYYTALDAFSMAFRPVRLCSYEPYEENYKLYEYSPFKGINIYINKIKLVSEDKMTKSYIGAYPKNKNEIMISDFFAKFIQDHGAYTSNHEVYYPKSNEDIINDDVYLAFGELNLKITGIYTLDYDYNLLRTKKVELTTDNAPVYDEELRYLANEPTNIYTYPEFFKELESPKLESVDLGLYEFYLDINDEEKYLNYNTNPAINHSLNDNEIIIDKYILDLLTNNDFSKKLSMSKENEVDFAKKYMQNHNIMNKELTLTVKDEFRYSNKSALENYTVKIVGYHPKNEYKGNEFLVAENILENYYYQKANIMYITIIDKDLKKIEKLLKHESVVKNIRVITQKSDFFSEYSDTISNSAKISCYLTCLLFICIMGMVLLVNLILRIHHTKNFGVLKALGLNSKDIEKIHIKMIKQIAGYSLLILSIILPLIIFIINKVISHYLGFKISFIGIKWYSYPIIFIMYIIMIYGIEKIMIKKKVQMPPIELIHNREKKHVKSRTSK